MSCLTIKTLVRLLNITTEFTKTVNYENVPADLATNKLREF